MTTDELERDLKTLAEPQEADERLRLAIRAQLGERRQVRPRRRFRPRLALGVAAVSAAAVAVAIVTLVGTGGSGGPASADAAIIQHALRAITSPANIIVHVKETGLQDGTPVAVEWWQQTSPPYAERLIKGPVGRQIEGADDGTTSSWYDAGTNTIVQTPGLVVTDPDRPALDRSRAARERECPGRRDGDDRRAVAVQDRASQRRGRLLRPHRLPARVCRQPAARRQRRSHPGRHIRGTADRLPGTNSSSASPRSTRTLRWKRTRTAPGK